MEFSFDHYNNLKQSKMFLANPQKENGYIGVISGAENVKLKLNFNSLHELSFNIFEYKNNEFTEFYDKIIKMRLIELQSLGWFQIQSAIEKQDENSKERYKEVKCYSLENELIYKKIDNISGVFALYSSSDTEHSLLHIISNITGYNIGHIDSYLLSKYRTFDIESEQVYNFLMTTVSKSFECVITYDTYTRTINCYELSNIGSMTDIIVSRKNILKEYIKDDSDAAIITKLRIRGADDLDIRGVNPTGSGCRINLDYFMTTEWGFKQSTIDAWNTYVVKSNIVTTTYANTLSQLKTKKSELLTLKNQLSELQGNLKSQEGVKGSCISSFNPSRTPVPSDTNYTIYQNAVTQIASYTTQIENKKTEISNKESEIASVQSSLNGINTDLSWSSNFTTEQINEINLFLTEDQDYEDSTFLVTNNTNETEAIDIKLELMQNGDNELARASQPQYTYSTTVSNILSICDGKDTLVSYDDLKNQLQIGNLITIKFREDYNTTARLMSILVDFDKIEDLELIFSDKSRLDDALIQLAEIIQNSGKAASSYTLNKFGYDKASSINNQVQTFMNGSLNATNNRVFSDSNIQTEFSQYGIINRKWLPEQNKYDDKQTLLTQNVLLFTDNNWVSSKAGIGYFTNVSNETYYGVLADVICGNFMLTSALTISNENNTITMNKDGATFTNCAITINKGVNTLVLNATDGIKLTKSGISQFYIDGSGNATFGGVLNAASGSFSGSLSAASGTFTGQLVGATGSFSGTLSAGISISSPVISGGSFDSTASYGHIKIEGAYIMAWNSSNVNTLNIDYNGNITCSSLSTGYASINGNTALHVGNLVSQCASNGLVVPNAGYAYTAGSVSGMQTDQITAVNTGYGNLDFIGFDNAAGVNYVQANFEPIGASDIRLKHSILSLDNIPDDLFYSLKPKQFKYKTTTYGNGIFFGLIAQEVENAFQSYGLNPYDYDLVELKDVSAYTDDGYYVDDVTHRIHYNNLISWMINIIQKQNQRIKLLENN